MINLKALEKIVGPEHVATDESLLSLYARTSGFSSVRPPAVVRPATTNEVASIMHLAQTTPFSVYPISAGKNWGYGDASAVTKDEIILDLSRMNKIIRVDAENAFAIIEAGVTQGQLCDHLRKNKIPLWMDSTGAGPDCSIVGNFSDRGFGHTRYGDHFASCTGLEVVLPDGRTVKTGFGHFSEAKAEHVFRYGVGPSIDGLFSQSNMGVITQMGVCLMPEPEDYAVFAISVNDYDELHPLIDALRPLRQSGLINSCVHVASDTRVFSGKMRYPWHLTNGQTPLPDLLKSDLRKSMGIGAWNATGILTGPSPVLAATKKVLSKKLNRFKIRYFSKNLIEKSQFLSRNLARIPAFRPASSRLALLKPVAEMMRGQPTRAALSGALWRVRGQSASAEIYDVLEHNAGIAWISPVMPSSSVHTRAVLGLLAPVFSRYGFDFMGTFTLLTERAAVLVSNVYFDRRDKDECRAAEECYKAAMKVLIEAGYIPYRCAPRSSSVLHQDTDHFWQLLKEIKATIDPCQILSPGRYIPPPQF